MLPQLVGDAQLTEGGLLDGKRNDGVLDLLWKAILQHPTTALEKAKTEKEAHGEFESEHPAIAARRICSWGGTRLSANLH